MTAYLWPLVALAGLVLAYRVAMAQVRRETDTFRSVSQLREQTRKQLAEAAADSQRTRNVADALAGRLQSIEAWAEEQKREKSQKALEQAFVAQRR